MRYWEDMNDKFGFSDGESVPPDAAESRSVYIRLVNSLAKAAGSKVRVVGFDRAGCHNWCMIVRIPAKNLHKCKIVHGIPMIEGDWGDFMGKDKDEPPYDKAMEEVLQKINEDGMADNLVKTKVTIDEDGLVGTIKEMSGQFKTENKRKKVKS